MSDMQNKRHPSGHSMRLYDGLKRIAAAYFSLPEGLRGPFKVNATIHVPSQANNEKENGE